MGVVGKSVVVARSVVQVEHGLRGLADGEPVAEVYLELWLIKRHGSTIRLCIELLLKVTEGQRWLIEAELGRSSQRCMVALEFIEVAARPNGNLRSLLIQTSET